MRRHLALTSLLLAVSGCGGWKSIERREWEVVWDKATADKPAETKVKLIQGYGGFGQEVISRDQYDEEIAGGTRRKVEPPAGIKPSMLTDVNGAVTLSVGELRSFRIDEKTEPTVTWMGSGLEVYLTEPRRVDGWQGTEAVEGRESMLHLVGVKPGKSRVQLVEGQQKTVVDVTVTAKK